MRWEYLGAGLTIAGIGYALMTTLPPPWWPNMPSTLVQLGVVFGLVLLAAGVGITGLGTWPGLPEPKGPLSLIFLGFICVVSGSVLYFSTSRAVSNVAAPASA